MKEVTMEDVINKLFQTLHRSHLYKPCFQKHGDLANVEYFILLCIAILSHQSGKSVTLSELIEITGMSMSAASKKVSILEQKGLVVRIPSDQDKRKICITLTEKGRIMSEEEQDKKNTWISEVISRMGVEKASQMLDLLNMMFDIMEDMEKEKTVN